MNRKPPCRRLPVCTTIEPLEARIAPATLLNPTTVTYQDTDGDNVTVHLSKPLFHSATINQVLHWNFGATNGTTASPDNGTPQQLQTLDFTALGMPSDATGVSITITAKEDPLHGGNGSAKVGFIKADGIDLGTVAVHGDLGHLIAGSGNSVKLGVVSLAVDSMGLFGTSTQDPTNVSFQTTVTGKLGSLKVKTDVLEAGVSATGRLGSVFIGGSLSGGSGAGTGKVSSDSSMGNVTIHGSVVGVGDYSGLIQSNGPMGRIKIGGALQGGWGRNSGCIFSPSKIAGVSIGTKLTGASGADSGSIEAGSNLGPVSIGGDVLGSTGPNSGFIHSGTTIGTVKIGGDLKGDGKDSGEIWGGTIVGTVSVYGSVFGGGGENSGRIYGGSSVGKVTVRGDLKGGAGKSTGNIDSFGILTSVRVGGSVIGAGGQYSGQVHSGGSMASVSIGRSVIGGVGADSGGIDCRGTVSAVTIEQNLTGGAVTYTGYVYARIIKSITIGGSLTATSSTAADLSGGIHAIERLGHVTVKGDIAGTANNPVDISAGSEISATARTNLAIAGITIGGNVSHVRILAGWDNFFQTFTASASIGAILVKGGWSASSVVAGVVDTSVAGNFKSPSDGFGQHDTLFVTEDTPSYISKIASVTIKGTAAGSAGGGFYGITAQAVGTVKIGSTTVRLTLGKDNLLLDNANSNFRLVEL